MSSQLRPTPLADLTPDDVVTSTAPVRMNVRSLSLTVLAAAAAMGVLYWGREVFIPIVLSILISYALSPVVRGLMRFWVPRAVASALVMLVLTAGLAYSAYSLSDDAAAIVAELPDAAVRVRQIIRLERGQAGAIQQVQEAAKELQKTADEAAGPSTAPSGVQRVQIEEPAIDIGEYISWGSAGAVALAGQAILIVFFVFFLLASGDLFKRKIVKIAGPSLEKKRITVQILDEINRQIERFLVVRVVTSAVVAVTTWLAFWMIGLNQAAVWGIAAGVFNSVPYFGPVVVAVATFVVAFLQFDTLSMAASVSGVSLLITGIEGWLLTPWMTSRTARTNEVAVFIGLIFWSFVWGIWGTLLAVPMLVVFKAVCDRIDDLKPVGELLAE